MIDAKLIEEVRADMASVFQHVEASADAFDTAAQRMQSFMYARGVDCTVHWSCARALGGKLHVTFAFVVPAPTCVFEFRA